MRGPPDKRGSQLDASQPACSLRTWAPGGRELSCHPQILRLPSAKLNAGHREKSNTMLNPPRPSYVRADLKERVGDPMWQQVRPQRLWRAVPRGQVADTASWEGWNYRGTGGEDGALRKFKNKSEPTVVREED